MSRRESFAEKSSRSSMRATVYRDARLESGRAEPSSVSHAGIEIDHRLFGIQDLEDLLLVRRAAFSSICSRAQRRPGRVAAARVADHSGEVTDQEDHIVAELLKLPHLVDYYRVAHVQSRAPSGSNPTLIFRRAAEFQLRLESSVRKYLVSAA